MLLALGSERYTPYHPTKQPAELLTQANLILGKGQLSLAKFLFITADDNHKISTHQEKDFFKHLLERVDLKRDLLFYTNTSMDTLDYSGTALNTGSKLVVAAYGDKKRELGITLSDHFKTLKTFSNPNIVFDGVIVFQGNKFESYEKAKLEFENFDREVSDKGLSFDQFPFIIISDDSNFTASNLKNWLWVTFTRANPSHDIYGINAKTEFKHFACDAMIIDARIKPHHAPVLEKNPEIEKRVDQLFEEGGSLFGLRKWRHLNI